LVIAPNQEFIVSVGSDGSIFFWETPMEIRLAKVDQNKPYLNLLKIQIIEVI